MSMQDPKDLDGAPLERLIKIMKMTAAEDTIALVAVRQASALLSKLGTDWEALLRGKVKVIADPFTNINIPQEHAKAQMNPNRNEDFDPYIRRPKPSAPPRPTPPPPPPPMSPAKLKPKPSPVKPKPGAQPFAGDIRERSIVNKYVGTCTKCKGRVEAGDGMTHMWSRPDKSTYWTTEHSTCPSTRRSKPAVTTDDFQI